MGVASQDTVLEVLSAFNLPGVKEWRLLPGSTVKRDEMVRIAFSERPPVLARFHDPAFYARRDVEMQTLFRSRLHSGGVPVPALYRDRRGRLSMDFRVQGETWMVTVEEWIAGEPPHAVTPPLVSLMGSTLARMHLLGGSYGPLFGHGTHMSLYVEGDEYVNRAKSLKAAVEALDKGLLEKTGLFAAWDFARKELARLWEDLPRGPVHADFAEYNLLLDETEDIKAVIDFNRAGDEVFINEVVHTCLRFPSFGDEEHDRATSERFFSSYQEVRPLLEIERMAVPYLVTIIRPFRWREARPAAEAAEKGDADSLLRRLSRLERLAEHGSLIG